MPIAPNDTRRSILRRTFTLCTIGFFHPYSDSHAQNNSPRSMNPNPRLHSFVGGPEGPWQVTKTVPITGEGLPSVERLNYLPENILLTAPTTTWVLHGATSNERYVTRPEKEQLLSKQPALGRPEANCAVLIPIKKNAEWWTLTQDERRKIFEDQSHHNQIGMEYLPAIARRLHHCRDLSVTEPFDFLTWFEFNERDTAEFDKLLSRLRSTEEWKYIEREVEVRVRKG